MTVITLTGKRVPDIVKGVALALKADCPYGYGISCRYRV